MKIVVSDAVRHLASKAEGLDFDQGHQALIRGVEEPLMLYHLARRVAAGTSPKTRRSKRGSEKNRR
jgi:hypothetical protein